MSSISRPSCTSSFRRNGFTVGTLSGQLPDKLAKLMELSDKPPEKQQTEGVMVASLEAEPRVVLRHLPLRTTPSGAKSSPRASMPIAGAGVLRRVRSRGRLTTRPKASSRQKRCRSPTGRCAWSWCPSCTTTTAAAWVGNQGVLKLETSRPGGLRRHDHRRRPAVGLDADPQQSCEPAGRLGHYFFTDGDGRLEQKLLIVRLSQTQHDGLFSPPEPLKLEE